MLVVTEQQREILAGLVADLYHRLENSSRQPEAMAESDFVRLAEVFALKGIVEYGNFEWSSPEMFAAAAAEVELIVRGAVGSRQKIDSKLCGHWAGRILGAALRAAGNRPYETVPS